MKEPPRATFDFTEGIEVHLTKHQRRFVAARVLKALPRARDNRRRVLDKYGDQVQGDIDSVCNSLIGLGKKVGLTDEQLGIGRGERA